MATKKSVTIAGPFPTVGELITALQELPPDLHVFVRGYEGGVDHVGTLKGSVFKLNEHPNGGANAIYGKHEEYDSASSRAYERKFARDNGEPKPEFVQGIELVGEV